MECADKQFLVVTPGGVAVHATPDPYGAAHYAARLGTYQWLAPTAEEIGYDRELQWAANPGRRVLPAAGPAGPPSNASRLSRLPRLMSEAEVMGISLAQAHATLLPIFQEASRASIEHAREVCAAKGEEFTKKKAGTASVATKLVDWTGPSKGFLSDNVKLQKRKGSLAVALGLNLLPEFSAFRRLSMAGVSFLGVAPPVPFMGGAGNATLCQGASAECMHTCLVNVGQNAASMRANYSKFAKAKALLEHPFEFMRVLAEALRRYSETNSPYLGGSDESVLRFVRLNVLSDIPWEEVAPWIFYRFPRLTFYDYTKVAGRPLMSSRFDGRGGAEPRILHGQGQYDLSFSYSGMNAHHCEDEFRRGRRIVQVYVAPGYLVKQRIVDHAKDLAPAGVSRDRGRKGEKDARRIAASAKVDKVALQAWLRLNPLPSEATIGGKGSRVVRVVDGDETDFRPLDPTDVIVGLRWKPAKVVVDENTGRREELGVGSADMPKHFVLYGDVVDTNEGPWYRVAESPPSTDGDAAAETAAAFAREVRKNTMRQVISEQWTVHGGEGP